MVIGQYLISTRIIWTRPLVNLVEMKRQPCYFLISARSLFYFRKWAKSVQQLKSAFNPQILPLFTFYLFHSLNEIIQTCLEFIYRCWFRKHSELLNKFWKLFMFYFILRLQTIPHTSIDEAFIACSLNWKYVNFMCIPNSCLSER